jgi:hypothetical protein
MIARSYARMGSLEELAIPRHGRGQRILIGSVCKIIGAITYIDATGRPFPRPYWAYCA